MKRIICNDCRIPRPPILPPLYILPLVGIHARQQNWQRYRRRGWWLPGVRMKQLVLLCSVQCWLWGLVVVARWFRVGSSVHMPCLTLNDLHVFTSHPITPNVFLVFILRSCFCYTNSVNFSKFSVNYWCALIKQRSWILFTTPVLIWLARGHMTRTTLLPHMETMGTQLHKFLNHKTKTTELHAEKLAYTPQNKLGSTRVK